MYIQHTHKQSTLFLIMELEEGVGGGGELLLKVPICVCECVLLSSPIYPKNKNVRYERYKLRMGQETAKLTQSIISVCKYQ